MRRSILHSCFALLAVSFAVSACVTKNCTLVGCQNNLSITYAAPVEGAYSLALSTGGVSATVSCPSDYALLGDDAGATAGTFIVVQCTSTGFGVSWSPDRPLGTNPEDAREIAVQTTVTPASTKSAIHGTASLTNAAKNEPNGAACGPTCYSRSASLTLAP